MNLSGTSSGMPPTAIGYISSYFMEKTKTTVQVV